MSDCAEIFRQFVTAINRHDVGALTALMTTDHVFVDNKPVYEILARRQR